MTKSVPKPVTDITTNKGIGGRGGRSQKRAGTYFEHQAEKYFNNETSSSKRILASGAFGKITRDPNLLGDIKISFPILHQDFLADCKFGYSRGEKQLNLYKEWFEKIDSEAKLTGKYPCIIVRFKGERGPNSRIIAFTWETFMDLMKELTNTLCLTLSEELPQED